ncbi:MAG: hypothetical protein DMG72_13050 [Acidobacteria bacterium]|nr:MAG: hypothetical protein DMG72_13050 [Acidobacteriota bacterium]
MIMPPLQETVLFNRLTDLRRTNSNAQILAGKLLELDTVATNVLALNPSYLLALHRAWKAALLDSVHRMGQFWPGDLLTRPALSAIDRAAWQLVML